MCPVSRQLVSLTDDNATACGDLIGASVSELHARARQSGRGDPDNAPVIVLAAPARSAAASSAVSLRRSVHPNVRQLAPLSTSPASSATHRRIRVIPHMS